MPAPGHNRNATRHGLTAGRLPAGCSFIAKQVNYFRRVLEQAVLAAHGEIDLLAGASINTAARWERHAQLCQRWLAVSTDLTHENKLAFSRDSARASSERDKAIAMLGLPSAKDREERDYRAAMRLSLASPDDAEPLDESSDTREPSDSVSEPPSDCGSGSPNTPEPGPSPGSFVPLADV